MALAVWLKAVHIGAIAVWAGGLLALPGLLRREHAADPAAELIWRYRFSRFAYDLVVSPAAVIAIASGTALIFITWPITGWLFVKLAVVAGLLAAHMMTGRIIDLLETPRSPPTLWRTRLLAGAALLCVCLILWLVLQKPDLPPELFPEWLLAPRVGALGA
jgi:uncharacterized membrane protein